MDQKKQFSNWDVKDPVDYKKIWNSKGDGKGCTECQEGDVTLWRPIHLDIFVLEM